MSNDHLYTKAAEAVSEVLSLAEGSWMDRKALLLGALEGLDAREEFEAWFMPVVEHRLRGPSKEVMDALKNFLIKARTETTTLTPYLSEPYKAGQVALGEEAKKLLREVFHET